MVRHQLYAYLIHEAQSSLFCLNVVVTSSFDVSQVDRIIANTNCPRVFNLFQMVDIHYVLFL